MRHFYLYLWWLALGTQTLYSQAKAEDISLLTSRCKTGEAQACVKASTYYSTEEVNYMKSYTALEQACALGSQVGCFAQARFLEFPSTFKELYDPQKAKRIHQSLCQNGYKRSCVVLAAVYQRRNFPPTQGIQASNKELMRICTEDKLLEACRALLLSRTNLIGFSEPLNKEELTSSWNTLTDKSKQACDQMSLSDPLRYTYCTFYFLDLLIHIKPPAHLLKAESDRLCARDKIPVACVFQSESEVNIARCAQGSVLACGFTLKDRLKTKNPTKLAKVRYQSEVLCNQGDSFHCNTLSIHYLSKGESAKALSLAQVSCLTLYNPEGCNLLGQYRLEENKAEAMKYYTFACEMGNGEGCRLQGIIFARSEQTAQVKVSFEKACQLSDWSSCWMLAKYFNQDDKLEIACQRGQGYAQACADMIQKYKESGKEPSYRVDLKTELLPVDDISFPPKIIPKGTSSTFEDRHLVKSQITFTTAANIEGGVDAWIGHAEASIQASTSRSFEESHEKVRSVILHGTGKPLTVVRRMLYRSGNLIVSLGFKQIKLPFVYPEDFELIVEN